MIFALFSGVYCVDQLKDENNVDNVEEGADVSENKTVAVDDIDCTDCMSVDLVLFLLFLGAVTLGMLLSGIILWVIMRVSRKKWDNEAQFQKMTPEFIKMY